MKKAIVLFLTLVLTLSLTVPAAAVGSREGDGSQWVPVIVSATGVDKDGNPIELTVTLYVPDPNAPMTPKQQAVYDEAMKAMPQEKGALRFGGMIEIKDADGNPYEGAVKLTVRYDNVTDIEAMQYINKLWENRKVEKEGNGIFVIHDVVAGFLAIFEK